MPATASQLDIPALATFREQVLFPGKGSSVPWDLVNTLLAGLRLNLREANLYLNSERPSLEQLEDWILSLPNGALTEDKLSRLRRALDGETVEAPCDLTSIEGLSEEELAHWDEHGYVILRNAVTPEAAEAAELAIYESLRSSRDDEESWYAGDLGHTIWVPLLHHPALEANRHSPRIAKAFSQLWGREKKACIQDLWVNVDQGGLNPPEREGWPFPGPHLHWDTTLAEPHHLDIGGILYLVDVAEDQGAFSCAPGFHRTLGDWLKTVPAGADIRNYARETIPLKPVAANRGDLVLWHQSLPHASSANRNRTPRVAQYIHMRPTRFAHNPEWL